MCADTDGRKWTLIDAIRVLWAWQFSECLGLRYNDLPILEMDCLAFYECQK